MVSKDDASAVFRRTFSRPFRLLFGNPVCALFSVYYAYIYGKLNDMHMNILPTRRGKLTCNSVDIHFPRFRAIVIWLTSLLSAGVIYILVVTLYYISFISRPQ